MPANLDELVERVITTACERLGFGTERIRGQRKYAIEFGNEALVDSLPGVPAGATFVGTFDREEAVQDETIDFFSSGHSLVEGILLHYDDSGEGRVACVELPGSRGESGIVAIYRSGADIEVIAVDRAGRRRHDWTAVLQGDLGSVRWVRADRTSVNWDQLVTRLRDRFDFERRPYVVLGIVAG